jgi:putative SOS response-associated peptidase YedK
MRQLFAVGRDLTGNLPPIPGVFPDSMAPVVRRDVNGERELTMMRWGMPGPPQFGSAPITNIRNTTTSRYWHRWLKPQSRCLVPLTSFSEYADTKPKKTPTWFALDDSRPLCAFAGIWTTWHGLRGTKAKPVEDEHQLYGFSTTDANGVVGLVHPKGMPVLPTTAEESDVWPKAPLSEASALQSEHPVKAALRFGTMRGRGASGCVSGSDLGRPVPR